MLSFLRKRRGSDASDATDQFQSTKPKSRRPPNTAFRQQRLKSWQPILTPKSVLPLLLIIAIIFSPLGIAILLVTLDVQDFVVDYSQCLSLANADSYTDIPAKYLTSHLKGKSESSPQWKLDGDNICQIKFDVAEDIKGPLYMFYKLTNFYQNHREYVNSYDLSQLQGVAVKAEDLSSDCSPLRTDSEGKIIYPCGLIANSMFNDTFTTPKPTDGTDASVVLTDKDISWSVDRNKFKKTSYEAKDIVPPPNWYDKYPDGYTDDNMPDISTWYEFQVWMRTAGLPEFYKMALKNDSSKQTLTKGTYYIDITSQFPVSIFGGTKSVVLTTSSKLGGRNLSLGICFLVVAGFAVLFAAIFLIKYVVQPRKLGDHSYLNFDQRAGGASAGDHVDRDDSLGTIANRREIL
ncbi:hypothetical protein WICPIJ_000052 [Wickerhamomyces pijperi]|uniref:Cell division control protein 50 n=1 Tax=Wickerhamomyces pijperi TaxID=599730 RepID=A0A9P8QEQ0_WICPI|nr:hypothetical protein WICPIJ_000052 [Wickerhamomyces pijperi]